MHQPAKYILVFAAFLVALAFRLPHLGERPFHGDEANQAMKAGILLETGAYAYDPHEHHGPTLYYGVLPVLWACGVENIQQAQEWMFRLLPALFGAATVLLVLLLPGLGAVEAGLAALFIALSNAMVFYSRYYIQESLFVFFAFLALAALLQLMLRPSWGWAVLAGLALGLTHATKETSVVLFAGMGFALLTVWGMGRMQGSPVLRIPRALMIAATTGVALAVAVVLFSSFFTHGRGVMDSVLTYATYLGRAEGKGSTALHDKPWYAYFELLAYTYREAGPRWSEGFALALSLCGIGVACLSKADSPRGATLRTLALYAAFVTLVFCLIPYKTPWNLLPFWQPLLVLAGIGAAWLLMCSKNLIVRTLVALLLAVGFAHATHQTYLGNFQYPADTRNPYVYAHTSSAINRLNQRLEDLSAIAPEGKALHINILKPDADYWPLPWYLRAYTKVGYWTQPPASADADVIIADPALGEFVATHTTAQYQPEFHALRPGTNLMVYIRKPLWDKFMEGRR